MEELLNVFELFVKLEYFVVQDRMHPELSDTHIFTLLPCRDNNFDNEFTDLLSNLFPQEIFMEIDPGKTNIELRAHPSQQDILVDAFGEILKKSLQNDSMFIQLLIACQPLAPFSRLLIKYEQQRAPVIRPSAPPAAIEDANTEIHKAEASVAAHTPIPTFEKNMSNSNEHLEEILPPPRTTPPPLSFFFTANDSLPIQPLQSEESELNWKLQSDLSNIVKLMDNRTEPTKPKHILDIWGGLKNAGQQMKNTIINPLIGDAEAAINIKEKLRIHSQVANRHYNMSELKNIMELITSRLLHVQQIHLQNKHAEEITFLLSAEKRTRSIREHLIRKGANQLAASVEPSTQALLGCCS